MEDVAPSIKRAIIAAPLFYIALCKQLNLLKSMALPAIIASNAWSNALPGIAWGMDPTQAMSNICSTLTNGHCERIAVVVFSITIVLIM